MKIRPVETELFHADGRTDMTELLVAFCNLRTRLKTAELLRARSGADSLARLLAFLAKQLICVVLKLGLRVCVKGIWSWSPIMAVNFIASVWIERKIRA
jgi:hypothetical protein